jgi:hypothetical protein
MSRCLAPLLLAALLPALLIPRAALAVEKRIRLTVEVKAEGEEGVAGTGADQTAGKFREGYTLVTFLKSDGELAQFNTKDPEYGQKMMGMAANVQKRTRGGTPAKKMSPQEYQAYMQKKSAECAGNQACLYKLAMEAQKLTANLDLGAGAPGTPGAPAYTGDEPPRYMTYFGYDNCGASAHVYVDRTTKGTLADVGGTVPYTIHDTADYNSNADELRLICNLHQAVYDTQDDTFWTDGALPPSAKGTSTSTMRGQTTTDQGDAATHGEILTWVSEQLRHAPRTGQRSATIKLTLNQGAAIHSGKYSGQGRVQMSWKFEDVM